MLPAALRPSLPRPTGAASAPAASLGSAILFSTFFLSLQVEFQKRYVNVSLKRRHVLDLCYRILVVVHKYEQQVVVVSQVIVRETY